MLEYYRTFEQERFISDETAHGVEYIKHNIEKKQPTDSEVFFEEDDKPITDLQVPICRLNRH